MNQFPSNPASRKAILVLSQHDVDKINLDSEAVKLLTDPNMYILRVPVFQDDSPPAALQNITGAGLDCPGNLLIQSPYDTEKYEDAAAATRRFALAKHLLFTALCGHLGAKEVVVEQVELITATSKQMWEASGKRPALGGARTTGEWDEDEKFAAKLLLRSEFNGGQPDLSAAEQLLKRTGLLYADHAMQHLVDMRNGSNLLKSHKLVMNLSSESKTNLSVAGRLAIPTFISLSGDYKRITTEQREYNVTVTVNF